MKIFTFSFLLFIVSTVSAQWSNTTNLFYDSLHMPVSAAPSTQNLPLVVRSYPDSGYFVIWKDYRNALIGLFAQKYDKAGNALWTTNGVPVSSPTYNQHFDYGGQSYRSRSYAATDGAGGFYVTYADDSTKQRVLVQHIKNDGSPVFSGPGFAIATATAAGTTMGPQLISDDNGGCYVAFSPNSSYIYGFDYKDVGGVLQNMGGGILNQNAQQVIATSPCGNYSFLNYPDATVWDYNIFSDLQGGCNIIMNLSSSTPGVMVAYNKLFRAKKNATVQAYYRDIDFSVKPETINYTKDSVYRLFYLVTDQQQISCGSNPNVFTVTQYRLIQNGFLEIDGGVNVYSLDMPKGVTIHTSGTINTTILEGVERTDPNTGVTDPVAIAYALKEEIYDSIPYQRTSNTSPDYPGYVTGEPAGLSKLGQFRDTVLATQMGGARIFEFSLAGGANQVYTAANIEENNLSLGYRNVRLQHLAVESAGPDSFAVVYKTNLKQGVIIGQDQQNDNTGGQFDLPQLAVNNNGNALFYIKESDGSTGPPRVSPIFSGAQLAWGAMGRAIGAAYLNGSVYNLYNEVLTLDPLNGTALMAWGDGRNASTESDIYMRHLDNLNDPNYQPPYPRLRAFRDPFGPVTKTLPLYGTSNAFTTFEVAAPYDDPGISPTVAISDNYNLGNVTVKTYENTSGIRNSSGAYYLDRSWTITPDNNPNGAATVSVRLFFTTVEFDALKAADPSITSPGQLAVIKQPGTGSGSDYSVVAGEKTVLPQTRDSVAGGYYIEIQVTSFSNFFIFKNANPLPLVWLGIQAQWQNASQATVSWQVGDQEGVKNYTVQHSSDGNVYTDACIVAAADTETHYSCLVAADNGKNYYRVVETDLDGKTSYSKVVLLESAAAAELSIYPNPVTNVLYVDELTNYKSIQITDMSGHVILRQNVVAQKQAINMTGFAPGIYILTVVGNSDSKTIKFIKN